MLNGNLKLAVQKKGRLTEKSLQLLKNCGIDIELYSERLLISARNFDLDILFLRDDDIPEYVQDGVADIGIVGGNVVAEKQSDVRILKELGFGKCTLMIAVPEHYELNSINELNGKTIATSYPAILQNYLSENKINAKIIQLSGSVEISPSLGVADCICDIVTTGTTLKMNHLKQSFSVYKSESLLISCKKKFEPEKQKLIDSLVMRIESALNARKSKYLMMNIPKSSLNIIKEKLPALKSPTILALADESMLALHAVIPSDKFWEIQSDLKNAGASDILLLPIENIIL